MADPQYEREHTWGCAISALVALGLLLLLLWFLPAFQGWHLGCTLGVDHERQIRVGLEWCR